MDYRTLFSEVQRKQKQAEERQKRAEERQQRAEEEQQREEEEQQRAEEEQKQREKQLEAREKQAEAREKQAEEEQKRAKEEQKRAKEEQKRAKEEQKRAKEEQKRAKEEQKRVEEEQKRVEEQIRKTTFGELIRHGHNVIAGFLSVAPESRCTSGKISAPIGKHCPIKLRPWTECQIQQDEIYRSVCRHLGSTRETGETGETAPRLFSSVTALMHEGQKVEKRPISSEKDLEAYERSAVEDHVQDIITELCKISAAQYEFNLGDGVWFDNHANGLDSQTNQPSGSTSGKPDQFCIHRVDDGTNTLLTTVEYKPPHKLPVESLRKGLRSMDLWQEVAKARGVADNEKEKAERLTGSVLAQEYHVMIQEGLEYSYVTNGLALVLLRVPYEDPGTLYYHLCVPSLEVKDDQSFLQPVTAIARVLCLCLMSFRSNLRDQQWRNDAQAQLPIWKSNYDGTPLPTSDEPSQSSLDSKKINPSPTSEYLEPSSSSVESPTPARRRRPTQSQPGCAPSTTTHYHYSSDPDPDSDSGAPAQRKRGFGEVSSSPSVQRVVRSRHISDDRHGQHNTRFCTQRCLLGLQQGGLLDDACPNVMLHKQGGDSRQHIINSTTLVQLVKQQLDDNLDRNCTPMGGCGASGAPFKITCAAYGYTIVGKGTTSWLWDQLLREAEVYHVLRQAQGSAVPVFLGPIDLAMTYFLHGAGAIRHMLLMAWAGESTCSIGHQEEVRREISRSEKEIKSFGVLHRDLRLENILWNAELGRALVIDFHCAKLDHRKKERMKSRKRHSCGTEARQSKRLRTLANESSA